nr:hypothetical protein [Tanacetum cinerariifolium]
MARNKEMYIISSHTKKIFPNMKRIGAGFSGVITPLFDTMIVQAPTDMGDTPVENHQTPIVDQPSTSKPQKKQNPKRKQRKEAEVSNDESEDEDHVHTPSSNLLPSGEDSFILNELMVLCTSLQEQGRKNDDEMFRVDDLAGEEVVIDTTTGEHEEQIIEDVSTAEPVTTAGEVVTTTNVKDSAASTTNVTEDGITMAQDKGKAKVIEPEVLIKKKDQIRIDEEYVRKLEAKEQEVDENVEPVIDDSEELKKCMEIVPDDGDEEGKKTYFKIIRADGNSQVYQTFEKMFKNFNREDLEVL